MSELLSLQPSSLVDPDVIIASIKLREALDLTRPRGHFSMRQVCKGMQNGEQGGRSCPSSLVLIICRTFSMRQVCRGPSFFLSFATCFSFVVILGVSEYLSHPISLFLSFYLCLVFVSS